MHYHYHDYNYEHHCHYDHRFPLLLAKETKELQDNPVHTIKVKEKFTDFDKGVDAHNVVYLIGQKLGLGF